MKKSDWVIALALALCAAVLAACGSSASGGEGQASIEEAQLEFAECMREHGVDMPDPKPGQQGVLFGAVKGGPAGKSRSTNGINPNDPATKKALAACESKMPKAQKMSPQQEEKFKESALEFAQCMREHGVDMPDPQFDGTGKVSMKIEKGGLDPGSPAFEAAQEKCQKGPGGMVMGVPAPPR